MDAQKEPKKQDVGQVILEELTGKGPKKNSRKVIGQSILIPLLAVFTGLVIGALFIIVTSEQVYAGFKISFGDGLSAAWVSVSSAYWALFKGSIGDPAAIIAALQSGDSALIAHAFNPILESLVASTPYIFAGLAVALGFQSGVFNIGAEGQVFIGALCAAFAGYSIKGLPAIIHIPLALLAGAAGGFVWGFIPGWLKAKTGGHEVINTIMMNYIAFRLSDFLLTGPMKRPDSANPISPTIEPSAMLPRLFENPIRFHIGFFIALLMAFAVWWLLYRTTWGFNLRTVGANPNAAKYAGISVTRNIVLAMGLSGALAALAGANDVLGVNHNLAMSFSSGYGFDSIALALLGNNHPAGVVLAALLFGTLTNGATRMQVESNVPIYIIPILQAVILIFIAAPAIIRSIYRLRKPAVEEAGVTISSWGGSK